MSVSMSASCPVHPSRWRQLAKRGERGDCSTRQDKNYCQILPEIFENRHHQTLSVIPTSPIDNVPS